MDIMRVMLNLLKNLYLSAENIKGKKLVILSISIFVSFILFGVILGNVTPKLLNKNEPTGPSIDIEVPQDESVQLEGTVVFIDPQLNPRDDVSFRLDKTDGSSVLLKASDAKLTVVEGLSVIVFGDLEKSVDGVKDILVVERVVVKNK